MNIIVFGRNPKNKFNIGIDVGWKCKNGVLWWGNTKDENSKIELLKDIKQKFGGVKID